MILQPHKRWTIDYLWGGAATRLCEPVSGGGFRLIGSDHFYGTPVNEGTVTLPAGISEGDITFVLLFRVDYYTRTSEPADWTELGEMTYYTNRRWWLYYKVYEPGDEKTLTWKFNGSSMLDIALWSYRNGFSVGSPICDFSNTAYQASDSTIRIAGMTAAQGGSPLIIFPTMLYSTSPTYTPPSGFVSDGGTSNPSKYRAEAMHKIADAGATGNIDVVASQSAKQKHGFGVILNPPYVGRNVPPIWRASGLQAAIDPRHVIVRPRSVLMHKSFFDPFWLLGANFIRRIRLAESADRNRTPWSQ
jgi:hypothetical protein